MEGKDLFKSKQFVGTVIMVIAMVVNQYGGEIDAPALTDAVLGIIGSITYVIGTFSKNRARIISVAGVKLPEAKK